MALSKPDKQLLIRSLQSTRNKGDQLEIELLIADRNTEARQVRDATNALSRQIRKLISAAKKSWRGQAASLVADMRKRNARLQGAIRDIQRKVRIAENVAKAVRLIDDAVLLAAKIVA